MPTLQFSSLSEFLQMGGVYTFHIWTVYLLFAIFIGYNLIQPRMARRQFIREQKRRAARDAELATKPRES
ncbi:MAG: heme exporter protein CcmD [Pseudohongiella sp.]|nr:heme exporter protein CcmD [Pseudohongiella sp.]MDP2285657.1 heme exporter protein CcmD [Pseudohongiella sp.]MDP3518784.1 heme exporter protein CcmD [Pseudohongiella sp.]